MLKAIFYARFHPDRGPSVLHQYPHDAIIPLRAPASSERTTPLIKFSEVSAYIIPPYDLCNRTFSLCTSAHRVLGFPVSLEDPKYARNRFTFSVCFVLDEYVEGGAAAVNAWDCVVRKTARFFRALEEDDGILAAEENVEGLRWAGDVEYPAEGKGVVYGLLKRVFGDLNLYGECCVRLSLSQVLNLRLENVRSGTVGGDVLGKVKDWDVPVVIREPPSEQEWTWDLVLQRIYPFLDGVNHVARIAEMVDVEVRLVKKAVWELVLNERAVVMPVFHFQAIYVLKEEFAWFIENQELIDECRRYVATDPANNLLGGPGNDTGTIHEEAAELPSATTIIELYTSLKPGQSLADFCAAHADELHNIDIRRFITFGLLKAFIRRIHKHALAIDTSSQSSPAAALEPPVRPRMPPRKTTEDVVRGYDKAWKRAALSSGWATPPSDAPVVYPEDDERGIGEEEVERKRLEREKLRRYLDGKHCLDQACVELKMGEKKVMEKLRGAVEGEVVVFCR